ncbi:DUF2268 domain-containing putative Zn-dependent protease [Bacillus sp. FJAT-27245]|uniref:DUF2268 domain-containing putative Zn-dependent protease n=1 Tax=Bacillus sp. FJAT-27245 TaxID=1684144 RepID=UPI0006A7B3E5|nr:DUF2268 domain-containing putative Zn-dependent protease [Bacillus sp. FJAT-27245]
MNIYNGLDLFREIISNRSNEEKYKAWFRYYEEYQEVFNAIFQRIYMADVEALRPVINSLDFDALLSKAESGLALHTVSKIKEALRRCAEFFKLDEGFDVFLLVGFGHIDGTAPPTSKPSLYFGLERLAESDMNILIPHEFNHLVRFHKLNSAGSSERLTVKQLVIAEGLATITPLILNQADLTDANFAKALMLSEEKYQLLKTNLTEIENEILKDFDQPLTQPFLEKYFMANEGGQLPVKSGYYYGLNIITALLQNGLSLTDLTTQETDEIYEKYMNLQDG